MKMLTSKSGHIAYKNAKIQPDPFAADMLWRKLKPFFPGNLRFLMTHTWKLAQVQCWLEQHGDFVVVVVVIS